MTQLDMVKNDAYDRAKVAPGVPVYLRHEQRKGWSAELPIYVLWCDDCRKWTETYPAGHAGRLHCDKCRKYVALNEAKTAMYALFLVSMTYMPNFTMTLVRLKRRLTGYEEPQIMHDVEGSADTDANTKVVTKPASKRPQDLSN